MSNGGFGPNLSPAEIAARSDLHSQRNRTMDEIIAMIARDLGYSDLTSLTPDERDAVEAEAEDAEERWSKNAEMVDPGLKPRTPLQRLLKQYNDLGHALLDLSEQVARRRGAI
ncbi:MAG: hypothetical protein JWL84_4866 [Rhodospirillales bacterium]|jgi:hypothetical protein|nr:hypothetical protein [Rhodospirillales bacterium]